MSKNHFHLQMLTLNNFGNQKMDILTLDKIFVLDNFSFVQDKKYFVWANGRGTSISRMTTYCINVNQLPVQKFVGAFSFCIGFLQQGRPKFHFGCTSHIDGNSFSNWQSIVNDDFCQRKDVNLLLSTRLSHDILSYLYIRA